MYRSTATQRGERSTTPGQWNVETGREWDETDFKKRKRKE